MSATICMVLLLVLPVVMLALMGAVTLLGANIVQPGLGRFWLHLCWLGVGTACGLLAAATPYTWLRQRQLPKWLLGAAFLLLLAVFVPGLGVVRNGAARWLPFGQPSEFAKLALAIYLADYCARNLPRMGERWVGFLAPASLAAAMALLVFKEPDWGTAALIGAVAVLLLTQAGANLGYVCAALLIGGEVVALLLLQNQRHLDRVLAYLHPAQYRHSIGWQAWNAILALASGGVRGAYFGQGNQSQGFVPESQTDFVLSRIGEEWGLVGGETIVAAFVCLLLGGAWIAWQTKDPFAHFLASGLTFLIALQAFIHIGVVSGALPCKGIPLPFVSYGGSNLVCMLTSIGLLVSIARYAPATQQAPPRPPPPPMPGPIGTLLESSVQPLPGGLAGLGRGLRRAWRNHRFPSLPRYSYQLPPRPLAPAPRGRGPG